MWLTWELRETQAPEGYEVDGAAHTVSVSATQREELIDHTYLTTVTYAMTVDGGSTLAVRNHKVASGSEKPSSQDDRPHDGAGKDGRPSADGKHDEASGSKSGTASKSGMASKSGSVSKTASLPKTGDGARTALPCLVTSAFALCLMGLLLAKASCAAESR